MLAVRNTFKTSDLIKRLKCKHELWHYTDAVDVYSDICGYEYTIFTRKCIACGKKKRFKTRDPDSFLKLITDFYKRKG